jgi:hypothetical protein
MELPFKDLPLDSKFRRIGTTHTFVKVSNSIVNCNARCVSAGSHQFVKGDLYFFSQRAIVYVEEDMLLYIYDTLSIQQVYDAGYEDGSEILFVFGERSYLVKVDTYKDGLPRAKSGQCAFCNGDPTIKYTCSWGFPIRTYATDVGVNFSVCPCCKGKEDYF